MNVRSDRHYRPGFTVLELVIIVMILGLVSAIGIPRFSSTLDATMLQTGAAAIRTHLTHARQTAISTGRPTSIAFKPLTAAYSSSTVDFPAQPGRLIDVDLADSVSPQIQLLANFDSYATITFGIDGVPRTSGGTLRSGVITLTLDGRSVQIFLGAATGVTTAPALSLSLPASSGQRGVANVAVVTAMRNPLLTRRVPAAKETA